LKGKDNRSATRVCREAGVKFPGKSLSREPGPTTIPLQL
jgi:hypothetical protein